MHLGIDSVLTIRSGNNILLTYQFNMVYPPAGQDSSYKRSGFIHPLYTPHGQVLTSIQPKDHYHHYGLWNPWTHTVFEKDTVDFWNLIKKAGTVRFVKFTSQRKNRDFAAFTALHEHVVFKKGGGEKVALYEWQSVKVYRPAKENDTYMVDFTSKMRCASQSPLQILAYRYGGLVWRATEYWDKSNSDMLTSAGMTRDNTDSTRAKWIIVSGALPGNDEGGMVLLSHPSNYNHPEPLRVWDKKANNGRGDVFINFAPTKNMDWLLEPGKEYTLKYRLIVFNGKMDSAIAETMWHAFAN